MISSNFKRITFDIQVPQGFALSEEAKQRLADEVNSFAHELASGYSKEGDGGIVVSNLDTLKAHHSLVVAVGFRKEPKKPVGEEKQDEES